jgi:murein DD-endopeptidase MepM/ murein hydrolase activator NlpD
MRNWRLTLLAAVAVLGLQACDQSPPQTAVERPQASLPDNAVLRGNAANPPQVAAAPAPAENASAPQVASTPPAPAGSPNPSTNAMGGPPETNPQQAPAQTMQAAPGGQGTAAMTELWQAFPPAGGNAGPNATNQAPAAAPATPSPAPSQKVSSADLPATKNPGDPQGAQLLAQRSLAVPVVGVMPTALSDNFEQSRGQRKHEAIDILAPAGTPVVAAGDGRIAKLFTSKPGGLTIYEFDPQSQLAYYYAHLQRYAQGVREGMDVRRGDLIGYVGSTGNADPGTPHLHFAVFRLGNPPKWWQGEAVNPYPALSRAQPAQQVASR